MMKICNCFFVAALVAAVLTGCGSSPSKNEIEKAVTDYVGMARSDIGEVKLDDFKILNEYKKKVADDEVCFRQFEAHYTVTYKDNPSKHSFAGTVAMLKQGQKWIMRKELCTLTFVYSPPILDAATQAAMDGQAKINANDPNFSEEPKQKSREPAAKEPAHPQ
jgi:hypothetical protein